MDQRFSASEGEGPEAGGRRGFAGAGRGREGVWCAASPAPASRPRGAPGACLQARRIALPLLRHEPSSSQHPAPRRRRPLLPPPPPHSCAAWPSRCRPQWATTGGPRSLCRCRSVALVSGARPSGWQHGGGCTGLHVMRLGSCGPPCYHWSRPWQVRDLRGFRCWSLGRVRVGGRQGAVLCLLASERACLLAWACDLTQPNPSPCPSLSVRALRRLACMRNGRRSLHSAAS